MPEGIPVAETNKVIARVSNQREHIPSFFCRHGDGLDIYGAGDSIPLFKIQEETLQAAWSPCGNRLLVNRTNGGLVVYQVPSTKARDVSHARLLKFDQSPFLAARSIRQLQWSPRGTYVVAFWQYDQKALAAGLDDRNVAVWNVANVVSPPGESVDICPVAGFVLKGVTMGQWPVLRWREDEEFCVLSSRTELAVYDGHDVGGVPLLRIHVAGIVSITLAPLGPNRGALHIAAFSPTLNGRDAELRILHASNLRVPEDAGWTSSAVAMLGSADSAEMAWSPSGSAVLVLANTIIDSAGENYGGIGDVYLAQQDGAQVDKVNKMVAQGVSWSPKRDEFLIIEGKSPSQMVLYNERCEALFSFPPAYRNTIRWDPTGTMIALGGFGSLAGDLTFWYRGVEPHHVEPIAAWRESCTVLCEWAPGSGYFFTASTFPRMRVDNAFKVFDFEGHLVSERRFPQLLDVQWKPNPGGSLIPLEKPTQQPSGAAVVANPRSGRELVVDPQRVEAERRRQMAHRNRKELNFTRGGIPTVPTAAQAARMEKIRQLDAISDWRAAPRESELKTDDQHRKRRTSSVKADDTGATQPPATPPRITPFSEEDSRGASPLSGSPRQGEEKHGASEPVSLDAVDLTPGTYALTTTSVAAVEDANQRGVTERLEPVAVANDLSVEYTDGLQRTEEARGASLQHSGFRAPNQPDTVATTFGLLHLRAAQTAPERASGAQSQGYLSHRPTAQNPTAPSVPCVPPPQYHDFPHQGVPNPPAQQVPDPRGALRSRMHPPQMSPPQMSPGQVNPAVTRTIPTEASFLGSHPPKGDVLFGSNVSKGCSSFNTQGSESDGLHVARDRASPDGGVDGSGLLGLLRSILPPSASVHVAAQSARPLPACGPPPTDVPTFLAPTCPAAPDAHSFRTEPTGAGGQRSAAARAPDLPATEQMQGFFDSLFKGLTPSGQRLQKSSTVPSAFQKFPDSGWKGAPGSQVAMGHSFHGGMRNSAEVFSQRPPQVQSGASVPFHPFAAPWTGEPSSACMSVAEVFSNKPTDGVGRPHPLKHKCWEYLDPQGIVRGPFNYGDIQKWYSLGYFDSSLPVRCAPTDQFVPLARLFTPGKPFGIEPDQAKN